MTREYAPASPVQPGMWFASTYGVDPTAYNQPLLLRTRVLLDHDVLVEALRVVHRAHVALRTTFEMDADGDLRQVVHTELEPMVDVCDHVGESGAWVAEQVAAFTGTAFDLHDGPLARVRHLRLVDESASVLVFDIHHSVFDGMSWKPYLTQVEAVYTALRNGDDVPILAPRQATAAYARWSTRVDDPDTRRFWQQRLADAPVATSAGMPGEGPTRQVIQRAVLDEHVSARLREFCREEGVTSSMFFVALCFMLLHRQTGQDDILLGVPMTVRDGIDADVLAHLTNSVVLRHRLTRDTTARHVLRTVKQDVLDSLRHRHAPLEAVVGDLRAAGGAPDGTGEVFNTMITVMPSDARRLDLPDWGVRTWEHVSGGAKYELAIIVDELPDHYALIIEHATAAPAGEDFTAYLAQRLATLVESVLTGPDTVVDGLAWVGAEEQRAIDTFCARRADAPELGTELTSDLFAATVDASSTDSAVEVDGTVTTYAELSHRVDALAASLVARGVRDGQSVAVLMRPGLDVTVAVLGILRAGGAYVTLDADQPPDRLAFTLRDCGAKILLRGSGMDMAVPEDIVEPSDAGAGLPAGQRKTPEDAAYIVYTSGSTGRPKGVVLPEATLANLVHNQAMMSAGRRMRTLQYMPPAFDVFAIEVFGALCTGGTLVIPPASARTDFEELAALLADQRVERVFLPYVALRELAAVVRSADLELPDLREVYVTGERLVVTEDLRAMFRRCPARLINAYGPSEAHLCSEDRLPADPDTWQAMPSIGRVVAGVDAYVLRDAGGAARRMPFGVEGELCVAGPVVSPGYLGLPDKTAQAMLPDPFVPGQLMYRTGDVVVLAPDGRLHYRGREDDQVKIRGYRVEPGEVESALERELGVDAAAVIVVSAGTDPALHALVQSDVEPPADWCSRLGGVLPGYMIPRRITRVDTFPVTPNGKTDRRALESLLTDDEPEIEAADWTDAERRIADLWTEVLGAAPATPEDDFFLVGGHSLLAARLHRLVRQRLDTDIPLSALLNTPTVRGMADSLADRDPTAPDLYAEAHLHDLTVAEHREPTGDKVLLTGATGFLGSHLLDELLAGGSRVACLVRADSVEDARGRLRAAFEKFAIDPDRLDEVEICLGDLARPRLGLGDAFDTWARDVREVYHAAAHINFVVPYHTVKRTNVDGLRRVLDFCGVNRTPLRLISTLGVFPPDSTPDLVSEHTVLGDPESLGIGYSQSKWVAEQLAARARRAGLPVTVHRVGRIGGHSRTGACRHDDFFWLQLKGFALLGSYPRDIAHAQAVDLLPVDYVARAIVALSRGGPDDETWHLHHATGLDWPTIIDTIQSVGHDVHAVDQAEWMAALEARVETEDRGQGLGSLVPLMREGVLRLGTYTFDNEKTRRALADVGCPHPHADTDWIRRVFAYFTALGSVPPGRATQGGHDG
ncbi:non-ribosomal peptide synthetase [Actinokineospora enzanensis]|uniref:non-ribosomal peptide synthetase family protein n=1 Tax=Actinokineospora enzanensis TaxID=155975 RepID=UPI0003A003BC|nr:non-ribosomal peptide synthetase [Actinokineospora enzanensis]